MEKLNKILADHVARGSDTKDKLLGAAFTVVNAEGESSEPRDTQDQQTDQAVVVVAVL